MFTTNADNHNYNTRHASDFEYPNNKLEFGNKSISYQGVKIWNCLPKYVKDSKTLNSFKSTCKDIFIIDYKLID